VILVAGLTPAWQQILRFEALEVGEVNRAAEAHWCGSGKVLNVGMALAHLGAECLTLSPLGGPAYEPIEAEFASLRVPRRWIRSQAPTRICTTLLDDSSGATTELVENAHPISDTELSQYRAAFAEAAAHSQTAVLTGSLPAGTPDSFYRDLLQAAPRRVVIDARGPELLAALECRPLVVKPNREELARTLSRPIPTEEQLWHAMHELHERGARWVVVSQGPRPVLVVGEEGSFQIDTKRVSKVVNPIGCGDCLAAGLAWGLDQDKSVLDAIKLGLAAASENLADILPARLDPQRVRSRAADFEIQRT
jgi:1-phosphofructokinase family hexose kinase